MSGRAGCIAVVFAWAVVSAPGCAKSDNGVGFGGGAGAAGYEAIGGEAGDGGYAGAAGAGGSTSSGGFAGMASGGAAGSATGGASGATGGATGGQVWINELHYDNNSTDVNEGVELAGTAGTNLTGWTLVYYNGAAGQLKSYMTKTLSGTIPNQQNGIGTLWFAAAGIQNGGADGTTTDPDGVALVDATAKVIQFLSYEGTFTPTDGAAAGMASKDIGKYELSTSPTGYSLQLVGSGKTYSAFTWADSMVATAGQPNTGQTF